MAIDIRIPEGNQHRYLRGGCFVFAHELRRHVRQQTGVMLALRAIWVDDAPEHAFLVSEDGACAYDARGRLPLDIVELSRGSSFEGLGTIRPITVAQMKEWARSMDGHNARLDIARYVYVHQDDE